MQLREAAPRWITRALFTCAILCGLAQPQRVLAQTVSATLDSARAASRRGAVDRATSLYLTVLRADSASRPALRELADVYSSQGKWLDALPYVKRLSALGESNFALERELGQWLAWSGETEAGLVHLRKAAALAPDSTALRLALGKALTWSTKTRAEGLALLRSLEAERPTDRDIRHALASALSWDPTTRPEGKRRLVALVSEDSSDFELVTEYADVLSWVAETRGEAMSLYESVLAKSPNNLPAARGRLNVLTWTGRTGAALRLADSLIARTPNDSALLLGRSSLLVQAGRPGEAVALLRPQVARAPGNTRLVEQLAYALLGDGQFRDARELASRLVETTFPSAPDWVRRGASTSAGIDVVASSTSFGLTLVRTLANVSVPVAAGTRVSLAAGPTRFAAPNDHFVSGSVSGAIEKRGNGVAMARAELGAEAYQDAPTGWTAAAEFEVPLSSVGSLRGFGRRAVVEDSRRAASGIEEAGVFTGQVRANTTGLVLRLPLVAAGVTLVGNVGMGVYTGRGLRSNARREFGLLATRSVGLGRGSARLEFGTGLSYFGFAFDANRSGADAPRNQYGGYWSPTNFGSASVSLGLIVPLGGRVTWRTDGSLGRLVSGLNGAPNQNSYSASSDLRLVGRHGWDASVSVFYLDNLSGFRLRQARASLRRAL